MRTRYDNTETKKRILSTCVRLFIEQGFGKTPPKQIFEEADVSAGTFYHIYHSKTDVLKDLTDFMFEFQFGVAAQIVGEGASPALLYAVETSIQLALAELNRNIGEIYVQVYTQPEILEPLMRKISFETQKIFSAYMPECTPSDFYEMEIGTSGIMRAYMAKNCDIYFTLNKKIERFVRMTLGVYGVPKEQIYSIVSIISKLDIESIADRVLQKLFATLEMRFDFKLGDKIKE